MKINAFRLALVATLGVGVGVLIITSVMTLSTILTYVGAAIFLALGLEPAISWLERHKFPRNLAITTVIVSALGVVAALLAAIVPIVIRETTRLLQQIPELISQLQDQAWLAELNENVPWIDLQLLVEGISEAITEMTQDPTQFAAFFGGVFSFAFSVGSAIFGSLIVIILTMYFTASLQPMKNAIYSMVPASRRERFANITEQVSTSVGRYVVGQLGLAAINGVLSFVFLTAIQAPFPILLAAIAFVLSLIPLVGTLTASIIIVLVSLIPGLGSPLTALVAAIYYVIYMQVEAYVLSPNIMNRAVQVPGVVVVIAALAGGSLLGVLGALVAIPVAAAFLIIIKQVVVPRQNER